MLAKLYSYFSTTKCVYPKNISENEECLIEAKSLVEAKESFGKYDVVLLAPQIKYQKRSVEKIATPLGVPVMCIDPSSYALCDGKKVLEDTLRFLNEK